MYEQLQTVHICLVPSVSLRSILDGFILIFLTEKERKARISVAHFNKTCNIENVRVELLVCLKPVHLVQSSKLKDLLNDSVFHPTFS